MASQVARGEGGGDGAGVAGALGAIAAVGAAVGAALGYFGDGGAGVGSWERGSLGRGLEERKRLFIAEQVTTCLVQYHSALFAIYIYCIH